MAIRSCIALGLNLQTTNYKVDTESSETRKRLWWSIVFIEQRISVMTGRVSCLGDSFSSAPPPLPFKDMDQLGHEQLTRKHTVQWTIRQRQEQIESQQGFLKNISPSSPLYFFYLMDLTPIAHAINNWYSSTDIFQDDWSQAESQIRRYSNFMDQWISGLHASFRFEDYNGDLLPGSKSPYQVSLALHYYSARIILNRPCFIQPEINEKNGIRFRNSGFDNNGALACLHASLSLISVLPDQPDVDWAYHIAPCWGVLHFLMQATIVLLMFLLIGPAPMTADKGARSETGRCAARNAESVEIVFAATKKALHWLHYLGRTEETSYRAFELCNSFLHRIAPSKGLHLDGLPFTAVLPRMHTTAHDPHQQGASEANDLTPQQQNQGNDELDFPQLAIFQGFSYNEGGDKFLSQEPKEAQSHTSSLCNTFTVLDSDIDISKYILHAPNEILEEILLSSIRPNF